MLEPLDVEIAAARGDVAGLFSPTGREIWRDLAVLAVAALDCRVDLRGLGRPLPMRTSCSKAMNRIWQILLGIEQSSPGVETGGDSRLELASLPRGAGAIAMILAAVLVVALLWLALPAGRAATCRGRSGRLLVGLRVLTLLAVAIMLLEPVLVSTRRETVPSQLSDHRR